VLGHEAYPQGCHVGGICGEGAWAESWGWEARGAQSAKHWGASLGGSRVRTVLFAKGMRPAFNCCFVGVSNAAEEARSSDASVMSRLYLPQQVESSSQSRSFRRLSDPLRLSLTHATSLGVDVGIVDFVSDSIFVIIFLLVTA
jgi:hypothetical protein